MSTIDNRVVKMDFDNSNFDNKANQTMSTLDRLKQKLQFENGTKGLDDIDAKSKSIDFSAMQNGIQSIANRFTVMGTVAIGVLTNVANRAVAAGGQLAKSFTVQPIIDGFHEYEMQLNSVQTILANTKWAGTNINQVNDALNTLNTYADKTIYNFSEMTRNIGTFTAAGVDLQTSVNSIKGIANLAAVSGSSSQQASVAMYQLSQAIAAGTVKLMDWNSVVNAGMGGKQFQDALIATSEHLHTGAKAAIQAQGSFRESLQTGWLTSQVLTETLSHFQMATDTAEEYNQSMQTLVSQGYTQEEAKQILDMSKTAEEAATKVKTFSQLLDTTKEAIGSGWTNTWQIVFGDYEEASKNWTEVSNLLNNVINDSANARNAVFQQWHDMGGQKEMFEAFTNGVKMVLSYLTPLKAGIREAFDPKDIGIGMFNATKGLNDLIKALTLSKSAMDNVQTAAASLGHIFHSLGQGLDIVGDIFKTFVTSSLSAFTKALGKGNGITDLLQQVANGTKTFDQYMTSLHQHVQSMTGPLQIFATALGRISGSAISVASKVLAGAFNGLDSVLNRAGSALQSLGSHIENLSQKMWSATASVREWIKENVHFSDVVKGVLAGLVGGAAFSLGHVGTVISNFVSGLKKSGLMSIIFGTDKDDKGISKSKLGDILDSLSNSLQALQNSVRAGTLMEIAAAITLLTISMMKLSSLSVPQLAKSVTGIAAALAVLLAGFKALDNILKSFQPKKMLRSGLMLIAMATALDILASAVEKLGTMRWQDLVKGLGAAAAGILMLSESLRMMDGVKINAASMLALVGMAAALDIMSKAVTVFAKMDYWSLGKGLVGVAGAILELSLSMRMLNGIKVPIGTALGLVAMAEALSMASKSITELGALPWKQTAKGLAAMGGALAELALTMGLLGNFGGKGLNNLANMAGFVLLAYSLKQVAAVLIEIGNLRWQNIAKGVAAMGAAIGELGLVEGALGKIAGGSGFLGAASLVVGVLALKPIANALEDIGSMRWQNIAKGLIGLGGALAELGVVEGLLGVVGGPEALIGAASLAVGSLALKKLANALVEIGAMRWQDVVKGLVGLGGALLELGTVESLIGMFAGATSLIGAAALVIGVQSLKKLSDALVEIGSMRWQNVVKGLVGLGGALTELAVVEGILGTVAGLPSLIGGASLLIGVQSLDKLANALQKFGSMQWDQVKVGLKSMMGALSVLAVGGVMNTLSGVGLSAVSKMAEPLGALAESVQKWQGVKAPEGLKQSLQDLADGVGSFIVKGIGTNSVVKLAAPLGTLADSIQKWSYVSVPKGLGESLSTLADGVGKFTFDGFGAGAIAKSAKPLGDLADSVNKWKSVTIPKDLGDNLSTLAHGIESFTLAFAGGWSLSKSAKPLGDLADSVNKWKDVKVPKDIGDNLSTLAHGVESFSLAFAGGWSLSTVTGPLKDLAGSVAAWKDVKIPKDLGSQLTGLADGILEFSFAFAAGWSLGTVTGPLKDLATSVTAWKDVKIPSDLGDQLKGLADGILEFSLAFAAGWSLSTVTGPLGDLAASVSKWQNVTVPDGLSSQLSDLASGVMSFSFAALGGWSLDVAAEGIAQMAYGVSAWANVTIPDGLAGSLGQLALGVMSFSFAALGGWSLDVAAQGLAQMAYGVMAWSGVTIPDGIVGSLMSLAAGVMSFSFAALGGWSLGVAADGLAQMAYGVSAWSGVSIPMGFSASLSDLASGVESFSFAALGGWSLGVAADGLMQMAYAIQGWTNVYIPAGIGDSLSDLASGVQSFSFAALGGWSLGVAADGLAQMAGAVEAWNYVSVPTDIQDQLQRLSNGVKSFGIGDAIASLNLDALTGPLYNLAGSVEAWNDVYVPDDIETQLTSLSNGIKTFSGTLGAAGEMMADGAALQIFGSGIGMLSGIDLVGVATGVQTAMTILSTLPSMNPQIPADILSFAMQISIAMMMLQQSVSTGADQVNGAFNNMNATMTASIGAASGSVSAGINGIASTIQNGSSSIQAAADSMASSMSNGMTSLSNSSNSGASSVSGSMTGIATALSSASQAITTNMQGIVTTVSTNLGQAVAIISNYQEPFRSGARELGQRLADGIRNSGGSIRAAVNDEVTWASQQIGGHWQEFYNAGSNLAQGFANGISQNAYKGVNAAAKMASDAVKAAQQAADEHSPSKKTYKIGDFFAQGMANGVSENADQVTDAATAMVSNAVTAMGSISPKIDSASVQNLAAMMNDMDITPKSISLPDISPAMVEANRLQKYTDSILTSNNGVGKKIDGLRDDMGQYTDAIAGMENVISVDGKQLAGSLAKPMNEKFGTLARRGQLSR